MNNYNYYDTLNNSNVYNLYGAYEGYLKGNMFKSIYDEYKNFKPSVLKPNSEKENDLFNLNQIAFAMHDLNLYLDVNPNDQEILNIFDKYKELYNELFTQYEKKYGAICVNNVNKNIPFEWEKERFPWEVQ